MVRLPLSKSVIGKRSQNFVAVLARDCWSLGKSRFISPGCGVSTRLPLQRRNTEVFSKTRTHGPDVGLLLEQLAVRRDGLDDLFHKRRAGDDVVNFFGNKSVYQA